MITSSGRVLLGAGGVLVVVGLAAAMWPLVAIGAVLAATVGLAILLMGRRGEVEYERRLDRDRVTRGEPALASLTVRNNSSRRIGASRAVEPAGPHEIVVPVPGLPAGSGRTVRYRLPTDRRCVLPVGPLRVERSDPFVLVRHRRDVGAATTLFVHPRRYRLVRLPSTLLRSLDGPTSDRAPRGSVVFHAIREYVPGDDRRHIHWRSTAKTGDLKVRQFVDTSKPDVTVVLDDAQARHSAESFEQSIEAVASLMVSTLDAGFPTRLILASGREFVPGGPHPSQMLLDHLAGLHLERVSSLERTLDSLRSGGNTLLVVARDLDEADAALIAARRSSFHTLLVALLDPDGDGAVTAVPPGTRVVRAPAASDVVAEWNASLR